MFGGLHQSVGRPGVVQAVIGVFGHGRGQSAIAEHLADFSAEPVGGAGAFKCGGDAERKSHLRKRLDTQGCRVAFGRPIAQYADRRAILQETDVGRAVADGLNHMAVVRDREQLSLGKLGADQAKMQGQFKIGNGAAERAIRTREVWTQQQVVAGIQVGAAEVNELPPVRQVGHEGPQVNEAAAEGFVGTHSGFHPT